jgi:DNA-directed RNA polymerase subunit H (RpoH/RPB5)
MKDQILREETIDLEEVIQIFDHDVLKDNLPQIETKDDVMKAIIHDQKGESMDVVDAKMNNQIDPSYQ